MTSTLTKRPERVGIIVNRSARRAIAIERELGEIPRCHVTAPVGMPALRDALGQMRSAGVTALATVGGDGSLSTVLTEAALVWGGDVLPAIVPVRGGTMNMVASQLGAPRRPERSLAATLHALTQSTQTVTREIETLRVNGSRIGFTFGLGTPARFLQRYERLGSGQSAAVRLLAHECVNAIGRAARQREGLFSAFDLRWGIQTPEHSARWSTVFVMRVDRLPLGFAIAPGASNDPSHLYMLSGDPRPAAVLRALPRMLIRRFRSGAGLTQRRVRALRLELETPTPWMVDGDVQLPCDNITVTRGPRVRIVTP